MSETLNCKCQLLGVRSCFVHADVLGFFHLFKNCNSYLHAEKKSVL